MAAVKCPNPLCKVQLSVHESAFLEQSPPISCAKCQTKFKPQLPNAKQTIVDNVASERSLANKNRNENAGWLIVHDENTKSQTFDLFVGKQLIGRKDVSYPNNNMPDIAIETSDLYMSRNHFYINVERLPNQTLVFVLSDANSKNHTFINSKKMAEVKQGDAFYLSDNDTIQAGKTKIVFKNREMGKSKNSATQIVFNSPKTGTVLF
jgi:pSer/pThr/pTyr-binding forkhead associated (FHA) protein